MFWLECFQNLIRKAVHSSSVKYLNGSIFSSVASTSGISKGIPIVFSPCPSCLHISSPPPLVQPFPAKLLDVQTVEACIYVRNMNFLIYLSVLFSITRLTDFISIQRPQYLGLFFLTKISVTFMEPMGFGKKKELF